MAKKKKRNSDNLKCRERLAVEVYVKTRKQPGVPLTFTANDVKNATAQRLNNAGIIKALQNMAYTNAGVATVPHKRGVYIATAANHPTWSDDALAALVRAGTSKIKKQFAEHVPVRRVAARAQTIGLPAQTDVAPRTAQNTQLVAELTAATQTIDTLVTLINALFLALSAIPDFNEKQQHVIDSLNRVAMELVANAARQNKKHAAN